MIRRLITIFVVITGLLSLLLGGCSGKTAVTPEKVFEVTKGNLDVTVISEGHLTMPDQYNLRFGTNGQVQKIFVQEGEPVKKGALLALLDDTNQRNAIKNALLSVQTAQNNITVQSKTDSAAAGCDHLPYTYPDLSVPRIFKQAQKDLDTAVNEFKQGDYKNAGRDLVMAYFDVEVGADLIASKPDAAALAGAKINSTYYPDLYEGGLKSQAPTDATVVDYMQKYQQKLLAINDDMKTGAYDKAASKLADAQQEMFTVYGLAEGTVYLKGSEMFEYPDCATSVDFLQSSIRGLQDLEGYLAQDGAKALEAAKQLYIAQLNLLVGRDVLENQTSIFVVGKGINWQTLQQYNLLLQNAQISLYKAKQAIMNTAIIAPADGTVVSVNLKISSVLSAQNYSSTTAISLVDTSSVRFEGLVDEIDIMKVNPGQKVKISVDALPNNKVLDGTVRFISPFGAASGNVIKFNVIIQLAPYDVQLRGGLSATATIYIYSAKDTLLLPVSVIVETREGPVVAVVNPTTGQPEYKAVTLGQRNFQYVEVLSGLKEGDKVTITSTPPTTGTGGGTTRQGTRGLGIPIR